MIAWKRALLAFHGDEKVSDEIGHRNLVQFRTGAEEEPTRKWKLKQQFESFWLATSNDNFYASSGAIVYKYKKLDVIKIEQPLTDVGAILFDLTPNQVLAVRCPACGAASRVLCTESPITRYAPSDNQK